MTLDLKKLYYYVICVIAFFVLLWGVVDLGSASVGMINLRAGPAEQMSVNEEKGEQLFDFYYQKRMLSDRLWDSLARIVVSGLVFGYCRFTVSKLEAQG